jgi:hypothetical protein
MFLLLIEGSSFTTPLKTTVNLTERLSESLSMRPLFHLLRSLLLDNFRSSYRDSLELCLHLTLLKNHYSRSLRLRRLSREQAGIEPRKALSCIVGVAAARRRTSQQVPTSHRSVRPHAPLTHLRLLWLSSVCWKLENFRSPEPARGSESR